VDIDLALLRALEREKDIPFDRVVEAIERALLLAYQRSEQSQPEARVVLDRKTGHVTVWAREVDEDGNVLREWDDTPAGFGRIAATTAKQEILQRIRDAEDEATFGEFLGKEGDIVSGTIQQGSDPRAVQVDLGRIEATLPAAEQVPGERYEHGSRAGVAHERGQRCSDQRNRNQVGRPAANPPRQHAEAAGTAEPPRSEPAPSAQR
jgi:N utilization substance protein A